MYKKVLIAAMAILFLTNTGLTVTSDSTEEVSLKTKETYKVMSGGGPPM